MSNNLKKILSLIIMVSMLISMVILTSCKKEEIKTNQIVADKVYNNAKIYSIAFDGTETHAKALAIKGGKFIYVGDEEGVKDFIGDTTEVVDCNGNSVLPGLTDAHLHNAQSAMKYNTCDLGTIIPNFNTDTPDGVITQIQEKLTAYIAEHPDDPVIKGTGWDRGWFAGSLQGISRPFTRHDVDAVISDRPVVLTSFCGHVVLMNTKALEVAGVTKDIDDMNGLIVREADGNPSGYIQEPAAFGPILHKIPNFEFTEKQTHDSIAKAFNMFAEKGFTLLCDCQQNTLSYEVLNKMAKNGEFTARMSGVHNINDATRDEDLKKAIDIRTKYDVDDLLRVDTVKYFSDGTYSMIEPYLEGAREAFGKEPGTTEPLLWDEEHMKESMAEAFKAGFNIHTHAMGDYAVRKVIDCYENVQNLYPNPNLRNIIAHCTFVTPEDRVRMGKSHIIASTQPGWFSQHPDAEPVQVSCWGYDIIKQSYPNKTMMDNGVVCAYGSDFPVNAEYGLAGIQVAMTRRAVKMDINYERYKNLSAAVPEECISLKEALKAHTINGAYQAHLENVTGSIEVGKSAELIVLDSDIESTPANKIEDIKVLETVFKGKTVYKK